MALLAARLTGENHSYQALINAAATLIAYKKSRFAVFLINAGLVGK